MTSGIAVVGAHSATKLGAPYDSPDWEIWACSYRNENELPRVDRWFEVHSEQTLSSPEMAEYRRFLAGFPFIYMNGEHAEYEGSEPYPIEAVIDQFGTAFLTCTPALMLALAISMRPKRIGLWGISEGVPEYDWQLPAICHFMLLARSLGIEVIDPVDILRRAPVYAFDNSLRLPIRR